MLLLPSTAPGPRRYALTHGPGVLQRVGSEHRLRSFGRPSGSSLVDSPDSESVQRPLLEPKHWEVARFLHALVAAHPLALSDVAPERRGRGSGRVNERQTSCESEKEVKKAVDAPLRTSRRPACCGSVAGAFLACVTTH